MTDKRMIPSEATTAGTVRQSVGELTQERLAELRRIAEAATPGPWMKYDNHVLAGEYARQAKPDLLVTVTSEDSSTDARHIATFDPPTVLALLDEIERLRRVREVLNPVPSK